MYNMPSEVVKVQLPVWGMWLCASECIVDILSLLTFLPLFLCKCKCQILHFADLNMKSRIPHFKFQSCYVALYLGICFVIMKQSDIKNEN
jgi:hypothetical protein